MQSLLEKPNKTSLGIMNQEAKHNMRDLGVVFLCNYLSALMFFRRAFLPQPGGTCSGFTESSHPHVCMAHL